VKRGKHKTILQFRFFLTKASGPMSRPISFSEFECLRLFQVILQLRNSVVSIFSTKEFHNRKLVEVPIWDCVRHFQVATGTNASANLTYFGIILKSSSTYHHIRLFSSSQEAQVNELLLSFHCSWRDEGHVKRRCSGF
jgi:hypothetical protein